MLVGRFDCRNKVVNCKVQSSNEYKSLNITCTYHVSQIAYFQMLSQKFNKLGANTEWRFWKIFQKSFVFCGPNWVRSKSVIDECVLHKFSCSLNVRCYEVQDTSKEAWSFFFVYWRVEWHKLLSSQNYRSVRDRSYLYGVNRKTARGVVKEQKKRKKSSLEFTEVWVWSYWPKLRCTDQLEEEAKDDL